MRQSELKEFRKLARHKQKWELVAHLMSDMLNALGVDTDDILAANKDEVAEMILNRHDYIKRANPLLYQHQEYREARKA